MRYFGLAILFLISVFTVSAQDAPLRLGIAGLSHAHLGEVTARLNSGDFQVVGIAERDTSLWHTRLRNHAGEGAFYRDLGEMLDKTKPEAVIVYENIYDHLSVVEQCAPRGIHVMVEKPLSTNTAHAKRIKELADKYGIMVLTNYETTWYPSNHEAYRMIKEDGTVGRISRINVYDGHQGPIEIGCGPAFLRWLTDPVMNGGGAVIDFGCYGANLATWLMEGQRPVSVYAVLKQQKPDKYPKVDDDATIMVEYPNATVMIFASWNWPYSRKDMHIYGDKGYVYQDNPTDMRVLSGRERSEKRMEPLAKPYDDPFRYLKAAVRGDIKVRPYDLSSIENNLIVVEILEAAVTSAKTGKPVIFE